jgi:hypothetical protein
MAPEVVVARGLPPCIEVGAVPVYAELSGQDGGGSSTPAGLRAAPTRFSGCS